MAAYIAFGNSTEQGILNVKDSLSETETILCANSSNPRPGLTALTAAQK